jgi:hypothetical protein
VGNAPLLLRAGHNKVNTILGGEEGDVLFLSGENIELNTSGNIAKKIILKDNKLTILVYADMLWIPND